MLPHRDIDKFIKKYNDTFKLKGYSKMNVIQKNRKMETKVKAIHNSLIKREFTALKKQHDIKMKKMKERAKLKPTTKVKTSLPKIKKKRHTTSHKVKPDQSIFD